MSANFDPRQDSMFVQIGGELVCVNEHAIGDDDYPSNDKGLVRCRSMASTGRRCAKYAAPDSEFCRYHGGAQQRRLSAESRYARFFSADKVLRAKFLKFFDDPDICDLRPELALQRAVLAQFLELADQAGATGTVDVLLSEQISGGITEMTKAVAELADKVSRIEKRSDGWVSRVQLDAFVDYVVGVISDHINDHHTLISIARQLEVAALPAGEQAALLSGLASGGLDFNADPARSGSGSKGGHQRGDQGVRPSDGAGSSRAGDNGDLP